MMLDVETQDWLDRMAQRGPAQAPATIGEAWNAAWGAAGLHTFGGLQQPQSQALDELRGAYRSATGADPRDDARARGIPIDFATPGEEASTIQMLSRGLPDAAQQAIAPHLDIEQRAGVIASQTERRAADVSARSFGVSANSALVLAGMARTMVDPATLAATAVVGAATPAGAGVPAFLAREFAVNAGAAAATHPLVTAEREKLGLAPTPFFQDVLEAGIGGAALGGLFRAGGWALRRAFGHGEASPLDTALRRPSQAARDGLGGLEPEDFDLAAKWTENRAVVDAGALRGDAAGIIDHGRALDAAAAALERGEGVATTPALEPPGAAALAESVTRKAYELSPKVFAAADALDNRIAGLRAEIGRIGEQGAADIPAARIAEVEAALGEITGKRRSSPRAQALRDELASLHAERDKLTSENRRLVDERMSTLRMSIVDMQSQRAQLGPKIRAIRAHAARMLGVAPEDIDAALRVAAARDELPKALTEPRMEPLSEPAAPIFAEAPQSKSVTPPPPAAPKPPRPPKAAEPSPAGQIEPARPLSDYSPRDAAPEPPPIDVKPKRPVTRKNPSLFEALAGRGLAPDPELKAIFDGNPFVPGFGRLLREKGMSLDDALATAKSEGYLFDPAEHGSGELTVSTNDLLDKLREEAQGRRVYRIGHEPPDPALVAEAARRKAEHADALRELKADKKFRKLPNAVLQKAAFWMTQGHDAADAVMFAKIDHEHELLAAVDQFEPVRQERIDDTGPIRGWDAPDGLHSDAAAASQERGAAAPAGGDVRSGEGGADARSGRSVGGNGGYDRGGAGELSFTPQALRADAERAIRDYGDAEFHFIDDDGNARMMRASEILREADEDAAAARELQACIASGVDEEMPF